MKKSIALMARVRKPTGGYAFKRIPTTDPKGRPINPKEPTDALCYYFRYTENGRQVMKPAGEVFADAVLRLRAKEVEVECLVRGLPVQKVVDDRPAIAAAVDTR